MLDRSAQLMLTKPITLCCGWRHYVIQYMQLPHLVQLSTRT